MAAVAIVMAVLFALQGCATVAPGQDPVAVRAEQIESAAFTIGNTFVDIEYSQRISGSSLETAFPGITAAANKARKDGPTAIRAVHQLIEVYIAARTTANATALDAGITNLNTTVASIQGWNVGAARHARINATMIPIGDILAIIQGLFQIYNDAKTVLATTNAADAQARAAQAAKEEAAFASPAWQVPIGMKMLPLLPLFASGRR
jgi:hypothetical protein